MRRLRAGICRLRPLYKSALLSSRNYTVFPAPLSRSDPLHVLNTSYIDASAGSSRSNGLLHHSHGSSRVRFNLLVRAILEDDFQKSLELLEHFRIQDHRSSPSCLGIYVTCLQMLLVSLVQNLPQNLDIHKVKRVSDSLDAHLKKHRLQNDILLLARPCQIALLECLVICCKNVPEGQQKLRFRLKRYLLAKMASYGTSHQEFCTHAKNASVVKAYCEIYEIDGSIYGIPVSEKEKPLEPSIETNKHNGSLGFEALCSYIEKTRFSDYDNDMERPLYELYDSLATEGQKKAFLHHYYQYSTNKQRNIEAHCAELVEDFQGSLWASSARFQNDHSEMLSEWYDTNFVYFNSIFEKLDTPKDLSPDEIVLKKHESYTRHFPKETLVRLVLSHLISRTLASDEGFVRLTDFVTSLALSFTSMAKKDPKMAPMKPLFVQNDDYDASMVELFTSITAIIMKNCTIPCGREKETQTNSLALLSQTETSDPRFFVPNDKEGYPAFLWGSSSLHNDPMYKKTGHISIHPHLVEEFKYYDSIFDTRALFLPMFCPPKPWVSPENGGYLTDLRPMVATTSPNTTAFYLNKAHSTGQLKSVYEGLDFLGSTAWAINPAVFDVFQKVMEYPGGFGVLPKPLSTIELALPEKPESTDLETLKKDTFKHHLAVSTAKREYHNLRGRRIYYNMAFRVALALAANGDAFFFPHQLDFRGRAYPMVSLLSHHEEDIFRLLLMFWEARPLGPDGLRWLKYHLAGVYGKDKLAMEDRLLFVDENLTAILDSAERPLDGNMWWKNADKPFQTLAFCTELRNALVFSQTSNIENFRTRMPVHQDGSCNGLQHYAALGADLEGGKSVNLVPNPVRQDVYSAVLGVVKQRLENEVEKSEVVPLLLRVVDRKVIKQTVMTSVYGVTRFGACHQIRARLKDILERAKHHIESDEKSILTPPEIALLSRSLDRAAFYLADTTLGSISELFSGASRIQNWLLTNCHRLINSFDNNTSWGQDFFSAKVYKPMMWTSLSGFPVVQLYKHTKTAHVATTLQKVTLLRPQKLSNIDVGKQMSAMAPNFIHSVDSVHMLMTALAARQHGIGFAAVHDSFWTYPSEVELLSKCIREEFIRLHSLDIVTNLRLDMAHTVRESYQLVWIKKTSAAYKTIRDRRNGFLKRSKAHLTLEDLNKCLIYELKTSLKDDIVSLIEKHQEPVFFQPKRASKWALLYNETDHPVSVKITRREFEPILYPVKILKEPPTGTLDLSKVLESNFFFS